MLYYAARIIYILLRTYTDSSDENIDVLIDDLTAENLHKHVLSILKLLISNKCVPI